MFMHGITVFVYQGALINKTATGDESRDSE